MFSFIGKAFASLIFLLWLPISIMAWFTHLYVCFSDDRWGTERILWRTEQMGPKWARANG